jgi:3-oxoacyl-[acyl-carrier protein] reductase
MSLTGKVAIVTGGARDIGREVSLQLAALGAKVVINFLHSQAGAQQVVEEIQQNGGEALAVKADVSVRDGVQELVAQTRKHFGEEIHILVNVAGGLVARKPLLEMEDDFWEQVMNINLKSVFMMMREVIPYMSAGASVVNFSSQAARDGGGAGASAYATSKGAVATFTRAMAKELGPKGIRVNAVDPGMIATTFHDTFTNPTVRTNVANATPLRREGQAAEVAALVVFLATNNSSFITGANIDINGGTYFS